jgi:hypothetical protein
MANKELEFKFNLFSIFTWFARTPLQILSEGEYSWIAWPLKTGPIGSPETSVSRCQPTPRNASEDLRLQLHREGCH